MNKDSSVIELRGVCHHYGAFESVKDVSLSVGAGEVVCLLGPSGCGKTTALRLAAGLETLSAGTVHIDGQVVSDARSMVPPEQRNLGLVFQDYALFPHMTVGQNVGFGLKSPDDGRVARVLNQVGLRALEGSYPHELSGGQQQRVALARALAPEPHGILMDEPFSGLDARLRESVRDRTLHILKNAGAAILMVTHDAEEAMHMADRIVVMRDGRIEQEGPPDQIYFAPANAFVASFFGDVNRFTVPVSGGQAETAIGSFDALGLPDGAAADVVVRPEALRLNGLSGSGPRVTVQAARMLGRTSLIHLETCATPTQGAVHIHARVPGRFLPEDGSQHSIELDRSQVFVFPAEDAT